MQTKLQQTLTATLAFGAMTAAGFGFGATAAKSAPSEPQPRLVAQRYCETKDYMASYKLGEAPGIHVQEWANPPGYHPSYANWMMRSAARYAIIADGVADRDAKKLVAMMVPANIVVGVLVSEESRVTEWAEYYRRISRIQEEVAQSSDYQVISINFAKAETLAQADGISRYAFREPASIEEGVADKGFQQWLQAMPAEALMAHAQEDRRLADAIELGNIDTMMRASLSPFYIMCCVVTPKEILAQQAGYFRAEAGYVEAYVHRHATERGRGRC